MEKFKCVTYFILLTIIGSNVFAQPKTEPTLQLYDKAPTFVLRNLEGKDVFLRDYCGKLRQPWKNKIKHVVILSFFTTYCKPCLKEIPELEKIAAKYKDQNLKMFLINLRENKKLVQKYINEKGFSLPILLDRYSMIAKKYKVTSVPRIFIINNDGKLVWMTKGYDEKLGENVDDFLRNLFNN